MSDTYSDWLVDIAPKYLKTFKTSFMLPNKSCPKRNNECSAMHLEVGLWPSLGTCRRANEEQAGTCTYSREKQSRTERVGTVAVQGTFLIQSSFCRRSHQKRHIKTWSKQAEPHNVAADSNARPCHVEDTLHKGSTSPRSVWFSTARTGKKSHGWTLKPGKGWQNLYMSSTVQMLWISQSSMHNEYKCTTMIWTLTGFVQLQKCTTVGQEGLEELVLVFFRGGGVAVGLQLSLL